MKNRSSKLQLTLQIILLLLAVAALYGGSLTVPFVFDDLDFFESQETLTRFGHNFFNFDLRWFSYATLGWTVRNFGLDLFWLRLGNVLLHAANAVTLLFLLRRLFQVTLAKVNNAGVDEASLAESTLSWFAFFAALLFVLHPVAVYGVSYLIQRSILMATWFVLLMLLFYLEGILRGGWRWMLAAAMCYFVAVYSKEHSIMAPGVALAMTFLLRKPSIALFKQVALYYVLATGIAIMMLLSARGVLGQLYEPSALGMLDQMGLADLPFVHGLSILTQSGLFFKYIGLWLLPVPTWMSVDMREPFAMSLLSWPHTLGLVGFLVYAGVALGLLFKRGRLGLVGFAMLFPWILFLTEWSVIRIQEPFVLYRSYLWMPGFLALLPVVFGSLAPKKVFVLLSALCLALIPLTLNRLHTFDSPFLLWDDAARLVQGKTGAYGVGRIYYNRGTELGKLKRYDEAIADFNKAIAENPYFGQQFSNRAATYYYMGKYPEALRDYNRAIAVQPDNPKSYYGRALTYRALSDFELAQQDFQKSCELGLCSNN